MRKRKAELTVRVPLSLVLHHEAEYRNSDEDGQDDISDDNSHQSLCVDDVAMATCCEKDERFERWTRTAWKQWRELMNLPGWSPAEPAERGRDTSDNNNHSQSPPPACHLPNQEPTTHRLSDISCAVFWWKWEKKSWETPRLFSSVSNGRADSSTKRHIGCREVRQEEVHWRRGSWCHFF